MIVLAPSTSPSPPTPPHDRGGAATFVDLELLRHGDDWRRWRALAADAPPYLAPEFFALVRPLVEEGAPLVAGAWRADRLIGALPLLQIGDRLEALRTDHSPGFDYCGNADGLDAIWAALRRDAHWNQLVLAKVPADSLLATRLPALARAAGCPAIVRPAHRHLYLALPGFEARMSAKFRSNLERCARKAGGLTLERIAVPRQADLDQAMAIEAMAWKAAAGTSIASKPEVDHVYRVLARLWGRRGRASLYFLRAGGERIATLFAVDDGRHLFALKIGYDPRFANISPGHLLVWKVAAEAELRGLIELDFVGREDEWKRKWTEQVHDHVTVVIYRRSLRGLTGYWLREEVKPRLPQTLGAGLHGALPGHCQHRDRIGDHTRLARLHERALRGFGLRRRLRRAIDRRPPPPTLGEPSRFAVGAWVRVKDEAQVRATLDDRARLRGLAFVPTQWSSCGAVFKVARQVRRLRDDRGVFRPVSRTVLLDGVDCAGPGPDPAGCGRHCPLMFRDEWLEPAGAPTRQPQAPDTRRRARVRDVDEIVAGLDVFGRRDGLSFLPEMRAYAGRRIAIVETIERVFEHDRWIATPHPVYILDGLRCSGAVGGRGGPCDRACALLWHQDWLILEDPTS